MSAAQIAIEVFRKALPADEAVIDNRYFHRLMAVLAVLLAATAAACIWFLHYGFAVSDADTLTGYVPFGAALAYCGWARYQRLFQSCALVCWTCLFSVLLKFPLYVAVRLHRPLADPLLAQMDGTLHVDVSGIVDLMAHHHGLRLLFNESYAMLMPLIVLASLLTAMRFHFNAAKQLIIGTIFGTLIGSVLFALLPAIGPWSADHFAPTALQSQCESLFTILRTGSMHRIDFDEPGFVCFPSFHVFLAVLAAAAVGSIRPLRIPAIVLTVLICVSTLTTGWHYGADVAGGLILAAVSILAARLFTRVEARLAGQDASAR